jgi:hypothetical protein
MRKSVSVVFQESLLLNTSVYKKRSAGLDVPAPDDRRHPEKR